MDLAPSQMSLAELYRSLAYERAVALYETFEQPSPADDAIAGECLIRLGRYEQAKLPLYRAAQRGDVEAVLGLCAVYVHTHEFEEALLWFDTTKRLNLSSRQLIAVQVLESDLHVKRGNFSLAISVLKKAWISVCASDSPDASPTMVTQSLVSVLQVVGRDSQAIQYLNKIIPTSGDFWRTILLISRALSAISLGEFAAARSDLDTSEQLSLTSPLVACYHRQVSGQWLVYQGRLSEALEQFGAGLKLVGELDNLEFEAVLCCWASSVYVALGDLDAARTALARLAQRDLAITDLLLLKFRQGVLAMAVGDREGAKSLLEESAQQAATLTCQRELGWAQLRLAQWHLASGDLRAVNICLEAVSDAANSLGNAVFLRAELELMGADLVAKLAEVSTPYGLHALSALHAPQMVLAPLPPPPFLRICTFGRPRLLAGDRDVTPRLGKAMALIVYVMLNPDSPLERITDAMFPDSDARAASNYFHQIRHKISRDVPQLRVIHDRRSRLYSVDAGGIALECDYSEMKFLLIRPTLHTFRAALELYRGPFMADVEIEWAEEIRNNLEWRLVKAGLRLSQQLYDEGVYSECCEMVISLRRIAPLDAGLGELLVRAINEIDGLLDAKRTLGDLVKYFKAEIGDLPPGLESLQRDFERGTN